MKTEIQKTQEKDRGHDLWWLNLLTGKRLHAGKAFYEELYGEYRLKIDEAPEEKSYFLKAIGVVDGKTKYRVEQVFKKDGKFHHRSEKGDGYLDENTDGDIYIDFGSAMKVLVLSLNEKSKKDKVA